MCSICYNQRKIARRHSSRKNGRGHTDPIVLMINFNVKQMICE